MGKDSPIATNANTYRSLKNLWLILVKKRALRGQMTPSWVEYHLSNPDASQELFTPPEALLSQNFLGLGNLRAPCT